MSGSMETQQYPVMQIKASPYQHHREAFELACRLFGLTGGAMLSHGVTQRTRSARFSRLNSVKIPTIFKNIRPIAEAVSMLSAKELNAQ